MKKTLLALVVVFAGGGLAPAQGAFTNLDFESAQLIFEGSPYPPGAAIATTNALPGWSAYSGTNLLSVIPYGPPGGLATPSFAVRLYSASNGGSFSGNYSVVLSLNPFASQATNIFGSISQTGLVPADAESLLFELGTRWNGPLTVYLGGQDLSYVVISNALNYTLCGAPIPSSLAGQTETLTFASPATSAYEAAELDDIQFSTVSVPEPAPISFICLGSGILFYIRKRRRF